MTVRRGGLAILFAAAFATVDAASITAQALSARGLQEVGGQPIPASVESASTPTFTTPADDPPGLGRANTSSVVTAGARDVLAAAAAETYAIRGTVTDPHGGGLPGVNVLASAV